MASNMSVTGTLSLYAALDTQTGTVLGQTAARHTSDEFVAFLGEVVASQPRRRDLHIIADNLSAHKGADIRAAIEARGASLLYLPPYSPDFNPIESMWSKVKEFLRALATRTADRLLDGIGDALRSVTPQNCQGIFRGYGYIATQKMRML